MTSQKLAIEYLNVESLLPDPKNARLHSEKQVRQIARSIKTFGFNVPLLVDADLRLVAGHGRLSACKRLGVAQVPVIRLEHLSEDQIRAFMIADNRLTETAAWDERLLGEQFKILSEAEINFTLDITGFEVSEIDLFIENLNPASTQDLDFGESIPIKSGPPVSRKGNIWVLGRHRLLCGDALNKRNYEALMVDKKAQMVFIDPPYNDPIDGYVTGFGKVHHPEFSMASGEMSEYEFTEFLKTIFVQLAANSADGALEYICMDWRHIGELLSAARSIGVEQKSLCVWIKDNAGQGSLYRSQHELILVFKNGKKPHRDNIQLGQFGRYRTNVWQYPRVNSLSGNANNEKLSALHPTIKPVDLVADAILDCTARGEVVLDAFVGSGTTVIASERVGRICYAMELEPTYVDLAVRRWQRLTGLDAINPETGQTFAKRERELADDRG